MKTLYKNKIGMALIFAVLLSLFFVSNCTSDPGTGKTTTTTTTTTSGGTTSAEREKLECELPSCSGECCEEDDDCKDICQDSYNKGLSIQSSNRDKCHAMAKDDVEKLLGITEVIHKANIEKLNTLGGNEESMNLLCAGVKELDYQILDDRIKAFSSSSKAQKLLGWVAETETALDVFQNAEDEKGVSMFKKLLSKAVDGSSSETDTKILKSLTEEEVETKEANEADDNNEAYFIRWALDQGNEDTVKWVHEQIIEDEKGLCRKNNWPRPLVAASGQTANYNDYGEAACIMAIYCKMAPEDNSEDNEFRQDIMELILNNTDVPELINTAQEAATLNGVLGLTDDDADNLTRKACCELSKQWKSVSALDLNLSGETNDGDADRTNNPDSYGKADYCSSSS